MDLIVQISSREALDAALEAGVNGVTVNLLWAADQAWWAETAAWQAAARGRGVAFYLEWDRLIREEEFPRAQEVLAGIAAFQPDALVLRDPGLCREARQHYPGLTLHAAGSCGLHNSPGLRAAAGLGCSRVVLAGPAHLKDLALMRRQADMPLEVVLPSLCPAYGHLCLLADYLGSGCLSCCLPAPGQSQAVAGLLAALELLPGLAQVGVAAVRLGGVFSQGRPLRRIIELYRLVEVASPAERPKLMAAARDVLAAFGEGFRLEFPAREVHREEKPPPAAAPPGPGFPKERPPTEPGRIWLEARDYSEATALARDWREPLILQLTPENYAAFLGEYRHWNPRRFIWRLPPVLRESALSFFRQAVTTLKQGGFSRFVAADWGAVELVREAGGLVYGEQALGVRNSRALAAARELGVSRVCLPPGRGPQAWEELVQASDRGSFWTYLYHFPALAVCPRSEGALPLQPGPAGENLRWIMEGELALLCPESPVLLERYRDWFEQYWVAPQVVSLPRSALPWGQVPDLAKPPRPPRQGPGGRGPGPPRSGPSRPDSRGRPGAPARPKPGGRPGTPPRPKPGGRRRP